MQLNFLETFTDISGVFNSSKTGQLAYGSKNLWFIRINLDILHHKFWCQFKNVDATASKN